MARKSKKDAAPPASTQAPPLPPQWSPPKPASAVVKPMTLAEIQAAAPPPPPPGVIVGAQPPPPTQVVAGPPAQQVIPTAMPGVATAMAVQPAPVAAPPPPVMQASEVQLSVEVISGAKRPTIRCHGYDASVAGHVHRTRQLEIEQMNQEEGKKWFRQVAIVLRQQYAADNVIFASPAGPVEVSFTDARRALDASLVDKVSRLPRVADLLQSEEKFEATDTGVLDRAFIQDANGNWYSLRQALEGGYPSLKLTRKTELRNDFRERIASMGPTVTEEEREAIAQLEAAGLNAPTVKVPGK